LILAVLLAAAALPARAELRVWKDKNGVTHFADAPSAGAPRKKGKAQPSKAQPKVTLYTTSWCPVCKATRAYLNGRGIAFVDYDVEKDQAAAARYRSRGGNGSVPLAVIGDKVVTGFDAATYDKLLTR
jgi:glutaredoxin-like YruB-family protein